MSDITRRDFLSSSAITLAGALGVARFIRARTPMLDDAIVETAYGKSS